MKPEWVWDVELLNHLANAPRTLQHFGYDHIELGPFYYRPGNVALGGPPGVGLFAYRGHGRWEGHYLFDPALTGPEKLQLARDILNEAFTRLGASLIVGEIAVEDRFARSFTRALGFTPAGTSTRYDGRPSVLYHMERSQWAALSEEL